MLGSKHERALPWNNRIDWQINPVFGGCLLNTCVKSISTLLRVSLLRPVPFKRKMWKHASMTLFHCPVSRRPDKWQFLLSDARWWSAKQIRGEFPAALWCILRAASPSSIQVREHHGVHKTERKRAGRHKRPNIQLFSQTWHMTDLDLGVYGLIDFLWKGGAGGKCQDLAGDTRADFTFSGARADVTAVSQLLSAAHG